MALTGPFTAPQLRGYSRGRAGPERRAGVVPRAPRLAPPLPARRAGRARAWTRPAQAGGPVRRPARAGARACSVRFAISTYIQLFWFPSPATPYCTPPPFCGGVTDNRW